MIYDSRLVIFHHDNVTLCLVIFSTVEDCWNTRLPIENIKPDVIGCALRLIDRYEIMGSANQLVTIALMLI